MAFSPTNRILCFGDSLTAGYVFWGDGHPYSIKLIEKLKEAGFNFRVENQGISGEFTTTMVPRFKKLVDSGDFNFAVILGGTNDLGLKNPDLVFDNLKAMHDLARTKGIKSVAVTIPEHGQEKNLTWIVDIRNSINTKLKEYCSVNNIPLLELHSRLPYHSLSPEERELRWSDSLHYTAHGYDCFGELVYETLAPILVK